ncbi:MAG: type II toxin-antitoxin system RelE/ParE family toxin [Opitutaceae bacterium]
MIFIEDAEFAKERPAVLDEDGLFELQLWMAENPDAGDIIRGSNGCRKLRWAASGRGKRGGARVIYLYRLSAAIIVLLNIYPKSKKKDLTPREIENLKNRIK